MSIYLGVFFLRLGGQLRPQLGSSLLVPFIPGLHKEHSFRSHPREPDIRPRWVSEFSDSKTKLFEPLLREEPPSLHDETEGATAFDPGLEHESECSFVWSSGAMAFVWA